MDHNNTIIEDVSDTVGGGVEKIGLLKHVFKFDDKTKNLLLNTIQYLVILVIPLKLINDVLEYLFENQNYTNRNNFVILAECLLEIILTIIVIFIIHRFITYMPTYSGTPISNINLIHIAILVAFYKIHNNERFKLKINYVINKFNEEISPKDEKKIVNVYNPLSKQNNLQNNVQHLQNNIHIPSQSDNLQAINPNLRTLEHQAIEQSRNQINNNNLDLGLLPQKTPDINNLNNAIGMNNINQTMEPEAANNGSGGFSSW
tara:strand:+ start:868 stop:1647 length:780 start_codon:yes stop_codon:yes gene_type:complete